jgi:hypothetical protein
MSPPMMLLGRELLVRQMRDLLLRGVVMALMGRFVGSGGHLGANMGVQPRLDHANYCEADSEGWRAEGEGWTRRVQCVVLELASHSTVS